RSAAVPRASRRADPAARPDARRIHRTAQDRRRGRAVGHHHRAPSLPRNDGPSPGLDPQRQSSRIHGLERRSVDRADPAVEQRHHGAARTARPRTRLPSGGVEGPPRRRADYVRMTALLRRLAVLALLAFTASAEAQSLKIADRQGSKTVAAQQLLADPATREIT